MTYNEKNIFAKIISGEATCAKVMENDYILAFMDVMPQTTGHTLVIPKFETTNLLNLPDEFLEPILKTTKNIANAIKKVYSPTGVMIMQLNGKEAGQTVFHLHFHIIQRSSGLEYKFHSRDVEDFDKLENEARKIRKAISI